MKVQSTHHWGYLLFSCTLAVGIWYCIHQSLITTKVIEQVPVYVLQLPSGLDIEGRKSDGKMERKVKIRLTGYTNILENLTNHNLRFVVTKHHLKPGKNRLQLMHHDLQSSLFSSMQLYRSLTMLNTDPYYITVIEKRWPIELPQL